MSTRYYSFDDTKADGTRLHGPEWDFLVGVVDGQLQGVLELQGAGVVAIPSASSLLVESTSTGVSVRPGLAVLKHSEYGHTFAKVETEQLIDGGEFEEGAQNFVHLALEIASETGNVNDTRVNQTPQLAVSDEEALDGSEPLAQVTVAGGVVTGVRDMRRVKSASQLWPIFFGAGRITGFNRSALAPTKVADSLSLLLPQNSRWFIDGQFIKLDFDVPISVPANRTAWGVLSIDEAGLPTVADEDWYDAEPPRGAGVVGRIVSDATSIVTLDNTTRDVLQIEAGKQERFEALEAQVAVLGAGTDPDDPDAPAPQVTVAMYNALKQRVEDLETLLAAIKDALGTDSPIAVRLAGRVETLRAEHSRLAASVVRQSPRTALRLHSAVVLPGLAGIGEKFADGVWQGAHYIGGNLRINREKRRLE